MKPEVICDKVFQDQLAESMTDWNLVKEKGLDVLTWWEVVVKHGVKKLAMKRSMKLNWQKSGDINL